MDDQARVATLTTASSFSDERLAIDTSSLSEKERAQMIEHFSHWALGEHASIASFARFTLQLLALGAPSHLLQASIASGRVAGQGAAQWQPQDTHG